MNRNKKLLLGFGIFLVSVLFLCLMTRAMFFNFIDNYELGYKYDKETGKIEMLKNKDGSLMKGYIYSKPLLVSVHTIDLRPFQVCINANSRVLNCKLIEFDEAGFQDFIDMHGRGDYSKTSLEPIMMSYAYDPSNKKYKFLKIKKELKSDDVEVVKDTIND